MHKLITDNLKKIKLILKRINCKSLFVLWIHDVIEEEYEKKKQQVFLF